MKGERRGEEQGFLSRWSQRKRQADDEPPVVVDSAATPQAELPVEPVVEPQPALTDADMPPLDSLDESSDYSGFLSSGVSEELRRLALRKLFRSAAFNVTDGLDDYAEDFTNFAKLGDIVTREMQFRDAIDRAREQAKALLDGTDQADEADEADEQAAEGDRQPRLAATPPGDDEPVLEEPPEETEHEQQPQST